MSQASFLRLAPIYGLISWKYTPKLTELHVDIDEVGRLVQATYQLNEKGRHDDCRQLLLQNEKSVENSEALRLNLVVALIGLNHWQEAERELHPLQQGIEHRSSKMRRAILCNQAIIEQNTGREAEAAGRLMTLCSEFNDDVVLLVNCALALSANGDHTTAEAQLAHALRLDPDCKEAIRAMANCLQTQGRDVEAVAFYRRLLRESPEDRATQTNFAFSLLRQRDFQAGWQAFEHRPQSWNLDWLQPNWHPGTPILGRSAVVIVDEGIGDAIMFSPLLEQMASLCSNHVIYCDGRLIELFRRTWPQLNFESQVLDDRYKQMDVRIRLGSLANQFRSKEEHFPNHQGFLKPDPNRIAHWKNWLATLGEGPAVGIAWRGGLHDAVASRRRSIPLEQWKPLLASAPARWICLQHKPDQLEIQEVEKQLGIRIHQVQGLTHNIDEMATLTSGLDAVISCEQTAVHVAGGVGTRCLVLTSDPAGWRYLRRNPDQLESPMIWYGSVSMIPNNDKHVWQRCIEMLRKI